MKIENLKSIVLIQIGKLLIAYALWLVVKHIVRMCMMFIVYVTCIDSQGYCQMFKCYKMLFQIEIVCSAFSNSNGSSLYRPEWHRLGVNVPFVAATCLQNFHQIETVAKS